MDAQMMPAYIQLARPLDASATAWHSKATTAPKAPKASKVPVALPPGLFDVAPCGPPGIDPPQVLEISKCWGPPGLVPEPQPSRPRAPAQRSNQPPPGLAPEPLQPLAKSMTTVVVRNLSGRYSQEDVLRVWPADGTFNFMHLPYNLLEKRPLGYVFIDFNTHELAVAFQQEWHGKMLPDGSNKKPLNVAPAEVQGKLANLELIKTRKISQLEKAGFLPLVFQDKTRMDSRAIVATLAGLRKGGHGAGAARASPAASPPQPERKPAPLDAEALKEKDECIGDADSDAPTTATEAETNLCEPQWTD